MTDWIIDDNGLRIPHVGSTPAAPVSGSTQLYADSADGSIYQRLPNGNISPLASAASGLVFLNSGEITTGGIVQIDIDISGYYGHKRLMLLFNAAPIDTTTRNFRMQLDSNGTAVYHYYRLYGATSAVTNAGTYFNVDFTAPDIDQAYDQYAYGMAELWITNHGLATAGTNIRTQSGTRVATVQAAGVYGVASQVTTINIYEDAGRSIGVGTNWQLYGYREVT